MLKLAREKWENTIHQNTNELISEQTWLLWGRTDGGCQLLSLLCVFIDTKSVGITACSCKQPVVSASLTERRIKGLQLTHTVKWSEQKFKNVCVILLRDCWELYAGQVRGQRRGFLNHLHHYWQQGIFFSRFLFWHLAVNTRRKDSK